MSTDSAPAALAAPHHVAQLIDRFTRRIEAGVHARAAVVDTERVGPLGGMVLLTIEEMEPAPLQRLSQRMARDKSQMTRIVQSLEGKGMVARSVSPDDGRVTLLRLTAKGRAFVGEIAAIMTVVVGEILEPLPARDRARLAEILSRL